MADSLTALQTQMYMTTDVYRPVQRLSEIILQMRMIVNRKKREDLKMNYSVTRQESARGSRSERALW